MAPQLMANPLGLPLGLQLYSVRELMPKDYQGTLRELNQIGYQEVEAADISGAAPAKCVARWTRRTSIASARIIR